MNYQRLIIVMMKKRWYEWQFTSPKLFTLQSCWLCKSIRQHLIEGRLQREKKEDSVKESRSELSCLSLLQFMTKIQRRRLFYRVVNSVLRWVVGPGRWHNHCTLRYVKQTLRQPSYFINKHVHNYFSIQERFAGNSSKAGFLIVHHTALNLNDGCAGPLWLTRFRH